MILLISAISLVVLLVLYFVKKSWVIAMGTWIFSNPGLAIAMIIFAIVGFSFVIGQVFGNLSLRCGSIKRKDK